MPKYMIVGQFGDEAGAQRACRELVRAGVPEADVSVMPGEGERRLVVAQAEEAERSRVRGALERQAPLGIDERPAAEPEPAKAETVTLSGAPADRPASPGGVPEITPMPTGSGALESRSDDWLVRREADLASAVDPDDAPEKKSRK